ncbi:ATP-binding protein [Stackebrandtia soli]|uniref:ATP-binding protein n=1 Tax=Stackebrandtia soli TaxID=1892856 RepID=UPI0039EB71ED
MMDGNRDVAERRSRPRTSRLPLLASMRIRTKLLLMLLIPVLALAGMASVRLVDSAEEAADAEDTAELVDMVGTLSNLIRAVQDERSRAAIEVYKSNLKLEDMRLKSFDDAVEVTNEYIGELAEVRKDFGGSKQIVDLLASADKPLSRIGVVRLAAGNESISGVHLATYNAIVSRLSRVIDRAVDLTDNVQLARDLRSASLLASADESSERLRVLTLEFVDGEPLNELFRRFMTLTGDRERALNEYRRLAAVNLEAGGLGSAEARVVNRFETEVSTSRSDEAIDVDHAALMAAFDARHSGSAVLLHDTLQATAGEAQDILDSVIRRVLIEVALVVLTLTLAVLAAVWLGRDVVLGLGRLRDSALRVASTDLPTAVRAVDENKDLSGLTPEEFADRSAPPLAAEGTDELAEVAGAFNQVNREAIRIAAQQALLRVHIGSMFVRLARRGHSLTGRLTAELDAAERDEQDPDRLQRLFRLDHLVSLQGRANDSLLVLGGASAAKVRTSNERLGDILKAGQGHTEHYTRVNFGDIDDGVWVKPGAVDDIVQLLAELMDNATKYSSVPAEVSARSHGNQVLVEIRDYGIGIGRARMAMFNARLSASSPLDLEALQAMGLTVVGMLAARNGIAVRLSPAPDRGTVAEVLLPTSVLDFAASIAALAGAPAQLPAGPGTIPAPAQRQEAPLFRKVPRPKRAPNGPHAGRQTPEDTGVDDSPLIQFEWQTVYPDGSPRAGAALPPPRSTRVDDQGLPHRQPMSNLVPGAAPSTPEPSTPQSESMRRDPASIGATWVAYARGLTGNRIPQQPQPDPRNLHDEQR